MAGLINRLGVRVVPLTRRQRFALELGAAAGALLLLWLDSPGSPLALDASRARHIAGFVSVIVAGIEILAGWVATAAEVTAAYVWVALQWLGAATATLLKNTGAMFAKVWDGMKIVWSDVLKPALVWVDDHLKRLYAWLKDTFRPVFDFLARGADGSPTSTRRSCGRRRHDRIHAAAQSRAARLSHRVSPVARSDVAADRAARRRAVPLDQPAAK
jgi:hypothetical protein